MSLQSEIAFAHQNNRIALAHATAARTMKLWRRISVADLDAHWSLIAPQMVAQIVAAQTEAASQSTEFLTAMDASYPTFTPKPAAIVPQAFTNVMGDGREIAPALYGAITNTKTAIGGGMSPGRAFEVGANFIALITQAAVTDMGRAADQVLSVGKTYTYYIRCVNGAACSRCAVLAGIYSAEEAFQRHVHCMCTTAPITTSAPAKVPDGFHTTPDSYFESLSTAAQDRVFTKDGAEAIRQGADIAKVVNARRGAYGLAGPSLSERGGLKPRLTAVTIGKKADGSPLKVFATNEGRFRGDFRKSENLRGALADQQGRYTRTTTLRLMPEQIRLMAANDHDRFRELLKRYGYLQ